MERIILDRIDHISILPGTTPFKNYHILYQLREGINFIYQKAIEIESNYLRLSHPDKNDSYIAIMKKANFIYNVETNSPVNNLFANLVYWYSLNVLNYSQTIGMIDFLNKKGIKIEELLTKAVANELRKHVKSYISNIQDLEPVELFRNKIAAHVAITSPKTTGNLDNIATLIESMSPLPTFRDSRLFMGDFTWTIQQQKSEIGKITWSLTENYESLLKRYDWKTPLPNLPLKI